MPRSVCLILTRNQSPVRQNAHISEVVSCLDNARAKHAPDRFGSIKPALISAGALADRQNALALAKHEPVRPAGTAGHKRER
jgi:hypothetical protein